MLGLKGLKTLAFETPSSINISLHGGRGKNISQNRTLQRGLRWINQSIALFCFVFTQDDFTIPRGYGHRPTALGVVGKKTFSIQWGSNQEKLGWKSYRKRQRRGWGDLNKVPAKIVLPKIHQKISNLQKSPNG